MLCCVFVITIRFGTWATESGGSVKSLMPESGTNGVGWTHADWSRSPAASAALCPPDLLRHLRTGSGVDSGPDAEAGAYDGDEAGSEHGEWVGFVNILVTGTQVRAGAFDDVLLGEGAEVDISVVYGRL